MNSVRKWVAQVMVGLAVVLISFRLADRWARQSAPLPELPLPNSYEDLLSAASALQRSSTAFSEMSRSEVEQLTATNRDVTARARRALNQPGRVPLAVTNGWDAVHAHELKEMKHLGLGFAVEAKSHLLGGRTNEAARCNLDAIRLGQMMQRGILLDGMTGLAIEMVAGASLRAMMPQLDAPFCREAARALAEAEAGREPPAQVIETEKAWSARRFGLGGRIAGHFTRKAVAQRHTQFLQRSEENIRRTRRLILHLAARAYELEQQRRPASISELVPGYLKAIPRDPQSGEPFGDLPPPLN